MKHQTTAHDLLLSMDIFWLGAKNSKSCDMQSLTARMGDAPTSQFATRLEIAFIFAVGVIA